MKKIKKLEQKREKQLANGNPHQAWLTNCKIGKIKNKEKENVQFRDL